jgi:hypothetical protein
MSDRDKGLIAKYSVRRTDGSDQLGGRHHGCRYFVLDLTHDPLARLAAERYAEYAERDGWLSLATDLRALVESERERSRGRARGESTDVDR